MTRRVLMISFIVMMLVFVRCTKKDDLKYKVQDIETSYIDLKFIEESSGDIIVEYKNKLSEEITTSIDSDFEIFKIDDENNLHEIKNNLGHEDISITIEPKGILQQKIPVSQLSPKLEKGSYEIRKEFKYKNDILDFRFVLNIK